MSADELAAIRAVGSGTPLSFLPLSVREPGNLPKAVFVGWLTAFVPSVLLAMLGSLLAPQAEQPQFDVSGLAAIFGLVVFAPLVETLIMGTILLVLLLILPAWAAIVLSAAGWGVAHSLIAPIWGLVIWWPFLIFSTLFVAWRSRSLWLAFLVPACVHALQNLLPALLVATGAPA